MCLREFRKRTSTRVVEALCVVLGNLADFFRNQELSFKEKKDFLFLWRILGGKKWWKVV
jgi:hypothetical protein